MTRTAKQEVTPALTPWFKGEIKPVRKGMYQRMFTGPAYALWDGKRWLYASSEFDLANRQHLSSPSQVGPEWRGLAADPKGKS